MSLNRDELQGFLIEKQQKGFPSALSDTFDGT